MKTAPHESVTQLHDFVVQQAKDDAGLPIEDRRHQAEVVAEVLGEEPLNAKVRKGLLNDYLEGITAKRAAKQLTAVR